MKSILLILITLSMIGSVFAEGYRDMKKVTLPGGRSHYSINYVNEDGKMHSGTGKTKKEAKANAKENAKKGKSYAGRIR